MHIIVDGYNVMHALPLSREWPGARFQDRRAFFLDLLKSYAGAGGHRVTVVFDGAKGGEAMGNRETAGPVEVLYSPRGIEADGLIRRMAETSARPSEILLVSSDKSLSGYVSSLGASIARSDELLRKIWSVRPPSSRPPESVPGRRGKKVRRQNLKLW